MALGIAVGNDAFATALASVATCAPQIPDHGTYVKERWRELLDDRERVMVRRRSIGPGRPLGSPVAEPETTSSRRYWRTVADH